MLDLLPTNAKLLFRLLDLEEGLFLEMDLDSLDVVYIALENIHSSLTLFAEHCEDVHFFLYSTGDDGDRWMDEYKLRDGKLNCERHDLNQELFPGVFFQWLKMTILRRQEPGWDKFIIEQIQYCYESSGGSNNPICVELAEQLQHLYPEDSRVHGFSSTEMPPKRGR